MGIEGCDIAPTNGAEKPGDCTQGRSPSNDPGAPCSPGTPWGSTPFKARFSALDFPPPSSSVKYWWEKTGPLLSALLLKADYPLNNHDEILLFYHTYLLPLLGPRPHPQNEDCPSTLNAPWRSSITDDFSPLEPSWNVQGDRSTIRLSIEPIGLHAGTAQDPFNQAISVECMRKFAASMSFVDLVFFEHFVSQFYIPDDEAAGVQAKISACENTSQFFIAFDFEYSRWSVKAYFFPVLKALATGESNARVVSNSIRSLAPMTSWAEQMVEAMSVLEGWISSYRGEAKVEFISVDCVDEAKSRIKIYVRIPYTSLQRVKEAYCLGGRLRDEATCQGLRLLDELWRLMLQLPSHAGEDEELPVNKHRNAGTIFNFELRAGKSLPEPKVYLPVHHYCSSDASIAERLQEFFGRMGWRRLAKEYKKDMEDVL